MTNEEAVRTFDNAKLVAVYGHLDFEHRQAIRHNSKWESSARIAKEECERELRRRGLGLDGRPVHPVNVTALVD